MSQLWKSVPEQKQTQQHQRLAYVSGVAAAALRRRQHDLSQLRVVDDVIFFLEEAENLCPWNFRGKLQR
jgi:hypothetical protein